MTNYTFDTLVPNTGAELYLCWATTYTSVFDLPF